MKYKQDYNTQKRILEHNIRKAVKNAAAQRRSADLAKFTKRDLRVRPEFWEQAERDYKRALEKLEKENIKK